MAKDRAPSSKSSWIGMAAHEIDEITTYGASRAARLARELADAVTQRHGDLLSFDPRGTARLNYSPDAIQAHREAAEARRRARSRILGEDNMMEWLTGGAEKALAA